jgi:A/G-specific adenine glycosylase
MRKSLSTFSRQLLQWFDLHQRTLPWRLNRNAPPGTRLNPYHVLVSEAMLQQTQVSTVIPYFHRFIERFPNLNSLADAHEQEVLRLWQGLGYYSRAKNLQLAAKKIVSDHAGQMPGKVDELLKLPGIGRYTAGAVSSIAFGQRVPILDGNVLRVLCRIDGIQDDPKNSPTQKLLWKRAEEILPRERVGDFNSALMELGALVCTARSPQCLVCPVSAHCQALADGMQDRIPLRRKAKSTPLVHRHTFCVRCGDRYLIEQRPAKGRWAGMWQFITIEADGDSSRLLQTPYSLRASVPRKIGVIEHALTHRRYQFEVFACEMKRAATPKGLERPSKWVTLAEMDQRPLPRPHVRMVELLNGELPS